MRRMSNQVLANIQQSLSDTQKQWKYVLLIPLICLLFISITLLATPQAGGYEYSIYEPYSLVFWIVAGIIFLFPFLYLYLSHSKQGGIPTSRKSICGLLLVAAANLVLLLHIPKARGYITFTSGDTLHHIGYCVDILNSGHLLTQNHYPLSHVWVSITSLLTDLQPSEIALSTVAVFTIVFIIGMFSISRALRFSNTQAWAITAFSIFPILGYWLTIEQIMPSTIGWSLIPLLLMLVYRVVFSTEHTTRYLIATLVLAAACWFVHPEAVLFPAIMIVIIVGFAVVANFITRKSYYPIRIVPAVFILLFLVVGFLVFFLSTNVGVGQVHSYLDIFTNIIGSASTAVEPTVPTVPSTPAVSPNVTPVTPSCPPPSTPVITDTPEIPAIIQTLISLFGENTMLAVFFTSTASLSRKITLLISSYGNLLLLSALCLLTTIWYFASRKVCNWDKRYLIIFALFFSYVLIAIFFVTIKPDMWGIHRMYKYPVIFGLGILGLFFADIICSYNKTKMMRAISAVFTLSLVIMLVLSMCSFYRSPGIGESNYQVTEEDEEAMKLLYETRNTEYLVEESGNQHQFRFNFYLYGMKEGSTTYHTNIRGLGDHSRFPPANFGYDENNYLGDSYSGKTYYLQTPPYGEYQRWFIGYSEYWPLGGKKDTGTLPSSWEHLSVDSTVNKIISGENINLYLINPTQID